MCVCGDARKPCERCFTGGGGTSHIHNQLISLVFSSRRPSHILKTVMELGIGCIMCVCVELQNASRHEKKSCAKNGDNSFGKQCIEFSRFVPQLNCTESLQNFLFPTGAVDENIHFRVIF